MEKISIIECPRDAMQGWPHLISTDDKVNYINALLRVGFDTIDFGSFVSPKAIPQMADTGEVLGRLDLSGSHTSLLAIIANRRGAEDAVKEERITYLGFPFSISPEFQRRNANSTLEEAFENIRIIRDLSSGKNKKLVVYLSMGFGNPYGDPYDEDMVQEWAEKIAEAGADIISVADTVGLASPEQVFSVVSKLIKSRFKSELGVHLHSTPQGREAKLAAAVDAGCRRFDGAMRGIGGCPMAGNELVGNMDTEFMLGFFEKQGYQFELDKMKLREAGELASALFI